MKRVNIDREAAKLEIKRRMSAQVPDEDKIKRADYVIDNSGSLDATLRQVQSIYPKLVGETAERNGQRTEKPSHNEASK
jgi:dephospho-CoA kinase